MLITYYADYFNNPDRNTIKTVKGSIFDNMYGEKTNKALHFFQEE